MDKRENIIIVPVRMDGKYAKILINLEGASSVPMLMEFNSESKMRYANLLNKYKDELWDMETTTKEIPINNTTWIIVSYLPEVLDEVNEAVCLHDIIYHLNIVDWVGNLLYICKTNTVNENDVIYSKEELNYLINDPTCIETENLYLLNIDNQLEDDIVSQLKFLKNVYKSDNDLKIINLNSKK